MALWRNEFEICLSPRWDLNPSLSLVQRIDRRTRYQSAKGELAYSQGKQHSLGYVIREHCRSNLLRAFAYLTVLSGELARANPATLTPFDFISILNSAAT